MTEKVQTPENKDGENENKILRKLDELTELITKQQLLQKDVLTLDEAAQYLGLSKSYSYQLVSIGVIPSYKPNGKLLRFSRKELTCWLLSNKQHSNSELEERVDELFTKKRRA